MLTLIVPSGTHTARTHISKQEERRAYLIPSIDVFVLRDFTAIHCRALLVKSLASLLVVVLYVVCRKPLFLSWIGFIPEHAPYNQEYLACTHFFPTNTPDSIGYGWLHIVCSAWCREVDSILRNYLVANCFCPFQLLLAILLFKILHYDSETSQDNLTRPSSQTAETEFFVFPAMNV